MTWRRHLTTIRATLALWVLGIVTLAANARTWLVRHWRVRRPVPRGVHPVVDATPDVTIDLTQDDRVGV